MRVNGNNLINGPVTTLLLQNPDTISWQGHLSSQSSLPLLQPIWKKYTVKKGQSNMTLHTGEKLNNCKATSAANQVCHCCTKSNITIQLAQEMPKILYNFNRAIFLVILFSTIQRYPIQPADQTLFAPWCYILLRWCFLQKNEFYFKVWSFWKESNWLFLWHSVHEGRVLWIFPRTGDLNINPLSNPAFWKNPWYSTQK